MVKKGIPTVRILIKGIGAGRLVSIGAFQGHIFYIYG